ncbi:hypothetical protein Zmor_007640 [Zophobas morio]|uniref:7tm 6 domain containing protein n=1 Tax=Zophobas morio TaxID=2755281 RepID=A0AA38MPK2_9CUCU|nr:hypothetical protein Zmor_007640 [Zophobas morio]
MNVWKLTIKRNILMLRIVGLWPKRNEILKLNLYTFYAIISTQLYLSCHTFFQLMQMYFVDDLEALISTIVASCSELLASIKAIYFLINAKLLKQLMDKLNTESFQPRTSEELALVEPELYVWQVMYLVFSLSGYMTIALFTFFPILDHSVYDYQLPFPAWYPFNFKVSPVYEIVYFYQAISTWYLGVAHVNMDLLMAALMLFAGVQCDILCHRLKNLTELSKESDNEITECIKHHQKIISFTKECNTFVNMMVLGQFCSGLTSQALCMFELSVVGFMSNEFYSYLFYVGAVTVQIFLYCWFGNEIELKVSHVY